MSTPLEDDIILRTHGISMLFPGTVALDSVDYNVWRGKVNVIIGENGAGKSTLMKILAGVQQPSLGEIRLNGKTVHFSSTRDAAMHGIGMVHQELNLFENLNVAENIFSAVSCKAASRRLMRQSRKNAPPNCSKDWIS